MSQRRRLHLLIYLVGMPLVGQPHLVFARTQNFGPPAQSSSWDKGDHDLATQLIKQFTDLTDQLDDCTFKGRFSNLDAVPDVCNTAFFEAVDVLDGKYFLTFLRHGCAKWRKSPRAENNKHDCEAVGKAYWHLQEAVVRVRLANREERKLNTVLGDLANEYVAGVNPEEVSQQAKILQQLNIELEKPQVKPGAAYEAGHFDAELDYWMLHHCPTELVWGLPSKEYATASSACSALESGLERFEKNTLAVILPFETKETKSRK